MIRDVDKSTWMQFRKICLDNGVSATQTLRDLIAGYAGVQVEPELIEELRIDKSKSFNDISPEKIAKMNPTVRKSFLMMKEQYNKGE